MIDPSILECFLLTKPAVYRIRISGRMDPKWSETLQGLTLSVMEQEGRKAFTELSGLLPDQAALLGVLQQIYENNIPLLSVECLSAAPRPEPESMEGG